MVGAMNFALSDLYPGMFNEVTTRGQTKPTPDDQTALVDDEELAQQNPAHVDPATHRNMWTLVVVAILIMIFLNVNF
jgi:hypothetical protein